MAAVKKLNGFIAKISPALVWAIFVTVICLSVATGGLLQRVSAMETAQVEYAEVGDAVIKMQSDIEWIKEDMQEDDN